MSNRKEEESFNFFLNLVLHTNYMQDPYTQQQQQKYFKNTNLNLLIIIKITKKQKKIKKD